MPRKLSTANKFDTTIHNNGPFQKMPVHPMLVPYVKNIEIELITKNKSQSLFPYKVLPDLAVVMGLQYQGSLYLVEKNQKTRLNHCGISGLQTQYKLFQPENNQTKSILIRFYPWAINRLFNEAAFHFTGHALSLSEIVGNSLIARLEEQLATVTEPTVLTDIVQSFLIKLQSANQNKPPPKNILVVAQQMAHFDGAISITKLAKHYGLSTRSLERQFKNVIGLGPKRFLRLCQFQKALRQLRTGNNWEQIIEHLNYYDQAHFINSFKQFSGMTPSQLIASGT